MESTKNYNLKKLEWHDFLDLEPINSNMDVIDDKLNELEKADNEILNKKLPLYLIYWVSDLNHMKESGKYFCMGCANSPSGYAVGITSFRDYGMWPGQNWPKYEQSFEAFDGSVWTRNSLKDRDGWEPWEKII